MFQKNFHASGEKTHLDKNKKPRPFTDVFSTWIGAGQFRPRRTSESAFRRSLYFITWLTVVEIAGPFLLPAIDSEGKKTRFIHLLKTFFHCANPKPSYSNV